MDYQIRKPPHIGIPEKLRMSVAFTLFLFTFSCSTVLVYGIGLEKAYQDARSLNHLLPRLPILALQLLLAIPASRFLVELLLLRYGLIVISPVLVAFVCSVSHLLLAPFVPSSEPADTGEKIFYYGTVYLALSESMGYVDSLIIALSSIISFFIVTLILIAVRDRFSSSRIPDDWRGAPLILVSLGLLFIVLYSADVSWWLQGGTK